MCGIVGIWNYRSHRPVGEPEVRRLSDRIRHRGPDDDGVWVGDEVGLGFRRLSIIDLANGHQPMTNEDGSIWLVFNGEIYNFLDLTDELVRRGHTFRTRCDTETIIHAYEEYGLDFLSRIDGMFALAIWDSHRRRLILARDRLGKKPLIYGHTPEGIIFGSEIQALVGAPGISTEINFQSLADYLTLQYIPSPDTIFSGLHKLPAAHYLMIESGRQTLQSYWTLRYQPDSTLTEAAATHEIRQAVEQAVRARLVADVPLGAFLSGGIDSTIVVGTMAGMVDNPIETFSIGFREDQFNELPLARLVAEKFGTNHHEFIVDPQMVDILPRLAVHYGEPFSDPSALPTYLLSRETRQFVTVALSGDGGDETFAGYYRHRAGAQSAWWDGVPAPLRTAGEWFAGRLPASDDGTLMRRFQIVAGSGTLGERYRTWSEWKSGVDWREVASNELLSAMHRAQSYRRVVQPWFDRELAPDALNQMLLADTKTYLPDDVLVKVDIASMANSLEVRCPLLDHHVVELAAKLPPGLKLNGRTSKYVLRHAFSDLIPPTVSQAPKRGFDIPLGRWLRGDLHDMTHDLLLDRSSATYDFFQPAGLRRVLAEHDAGKGGHAGLIWALLILELWQRQVLVPGATEVPA